MIYCIEYVKYDWGHQDVNSGILFELSTAFPNEKIIMLASDRHIEALQKFNYPNDIEFKPIDLPYKNKNITDSWIPRENYNEIKKLFLNIGLKSNDKVIFFYGSCSLIQAVIKLAKKYKNNNFYICIHEKMEKILGNGKDKIYKRWSETIQYSTLRRNVYFIQYHPYVNKMIYNKFGDKAEKKFIFLYHPSENNSNILINKASHEGIDICVWGAAASQGNTIKIINQFLQDPQYDKILFSIYSRGILGNDFIKNSRIKYSYRYKGFSEEEMHSIIINADYVLIPYDEKSYTMYASGIVADAIRYSKPIIALNSPYITFFNEEKDIGFIGNNIDDLMNKISIEKLERNRKTYEENERKWVDDIRNRNIKILKERMK